MSSQESAYRLISKLDMGVGHLAQRLVYSEEDLLISLSNSLKQREQEISQRGTLLGRLMALFVGRDSGDTIRIDGMRLMQLLELAEGKAPEGLILAGLYEVDLAFFRERFARASDPAMRDDICRDSPTVVRP